MPPLLLYIAGFLACATLIVFSGSRLSKYGDIIADLTGMGKAWIGLILMAAITTLPELVTGISSIAIFDAPNLAVGGIMGSCAFNLLILAILDYFIRGRPLSSVVMKVHVMVGFLGIVLLTVSITAIVFARIFPQIGWFSTSSLLIIGVYLIAIRIIFHHDKNSKQHASDTPVLTEPAESIPLPVAIRRYLLFALLVVSAAVALPFLQTAWQMKQA
jgi:cation:H+ antiporter